MRYTLLEMVQLILSSIDGEEVNSISDTVEANQVALILKSSYYDLATEMGLSEHETVFQLNASGDNAKPCIMTVPTNITKVHTIHYDYKADADTYSNYQFLTFVPFEEFVRARQSLREDTVSVGSQNVTMNGENFSIMFQTNKDPQVYTVADDQTLIFDSYDSDKDTTLQKSKTMCLGTAYSSWSQTDNFVPDLDPTQFSLLVNRAKVRAFNELKQQINQEATSEARKQKIVVQKRKRKTPDQHEVYKVSSRFGRK